MSSKIFLAENVLERNSRVLLL